VDTMPVALPGMPEDVSERPDFRSTHSGAAPPIEASMREPPRLLGSRSGQRRLTGVPSTAFRARGELLAGRPSVQARRR
jgi:hypothetical protein